MKKIHIFALVLFSALFFTACGEKETKSAKAIAVKSDDKVEQKTVTLTALDGKKFEVSFSNNVLVSKDLNGKIVLINFWATWCPPCIEEIPTFNKLYEEHSDIFEIVGVLYERDKSKEQILAFAKEHKMKFPITMGEENFEAAKMFDNVQKIPESFLFSTDGFLFEKYVGAVDEKILEKYLLDNKNKKGR